MSNRSNEQSTPMISFEDLRNYDTKLKTWVEQKLEEYTPSGDSNKFVIELTINSHKDPRYTTDLKFDILSCSEDYNQIFQAYKDGKDLEIKLTVVEKINEGYITRAKQTLDDIQIISDKIEPNGDETFIFTGYAGAGYEIAVYIGNKFKYLAEKVKDKYYQEKSRDEQINDMKGYATESLIDSEDKKLKVKATSEIKINDWENPEELNDPLEYQDEEFATKGPDVAGEYPYIYVELRSIIGRSLRSPEMVDDFQATEDEVDDVINGIINGEGE